MSFFCSQYIDISNQEWRNKGCSISSLWMGIKKIKPDFNLSLDNLLEEGISINGFKDGFWDHKSISILAHNHGLAAYTEEFKSAPFGKDTEYSENINNYGVNKIFNFLKNNSGAVIASVPKNFDEVDKPHSILLHNVLERDSEKYFIYNDSEKLSDKEGENLEISLKEFESKWRRLAIFINKI
ncbi:MAG: hypothetical protein KBD12_01595 [Candidatus Pacebacteria bacterium]|nr:hypothetical protein [Candidatus Paceibacterota bacterium]